MDVVGWLLDADPAIRWQAMHDLTRRARRDRGGARPRRPRAKLRGLDHLRAAGDAPDKRVADAIRVVEGKRQPDGRWLLEGSHDDGLDLPSGEAVGAPSRWITLRALRVLRWYARAR